MNVNKKKLAEIFNVDIRTIDRWQTQGLPQISGGGKGVEVIFDSAKAIEWYAQREADIENEKRRRIRRKSPIARPDTWIRSTRPSGQAAKREGRYLRRYICFPCERDGYSFSHRILGNGERAG